MYATTFFTFDSDGIEIAGDLRSRLEWRIVRRALELIREVPDDPGQSAWQQAEAEIVDRLSVARSPA